MKVAFFDTHDFEKEFFLFHNRTFGHELEFLDARLTVKTAALAKNYGAVCVFANDKLNREALKILAANGVSLIALRSAGFNNVDLKAAFDLNLRVCRVPAYSPHAVAEHAAGLILSLNRKIHKAYNRVREQNFSLSGLVGFDLNNKTVGVLGTGKIGSVFCKIMNGFGCKLIAFDQRKDHRLEWEYGLRYVEIERLFKDSDIISLHLPLTPSTKHIIGHEAFDRMKKGCMLINTGRGGLVDSRALLENLKNEKLGYAGLDVYEEEEAVFFQDLSEKILQDDCLARLLNFPNVLITSHQAFLTREALNNISQITLDNIRKYEETGEAPNEVRFESHVAKP